MKPASPPAWPASRRRFGSLGTWAGGSGTGRSRTPPLDGRPSLPRTAMIRILQRSPRRPAFRQRAKRIAAWFAAGSLSVALGVVVGFYIWAPGVVKQFNELREKLYRERERNKQLKGM